MIEWPEAPEFRDFIRGYKFAANGDILPVLGKYCSCDDYAKLRAAAEKLLAENEALRKGHVRYEIVRRMSPRQFAAACDLNVKIGKPFDQIIDELAPFCGISQGE